MTAGRISVVVITMDRREQLLATLDVLGRDPAAARVVVVDNGSVDGTPDAVRAAHPHVDLVVLPCNLGAAARTVGVHRATTPYVAFCDDDARWLPGSLARATALLDAHPRVGAVVGSVVVGPRCRPDPTSCEMAASPLPPRAGTGPGPGLVGMLASATALRREAYLATGGYRTSYGIGGEERLLALDLRARGWDVCYVADVVVQHLPRDEGRRPARRRRTVLRNDLWTAWMRLPLPLALRESATVLRAARPDDAAWALAAALGGARPVLAGRAVLDDEVVEDLRRVRRARGGAP